MSSDFNKWGAIANGEYSVNYDKKGKSGSLESHWTLNNRGKVPVLGEINPSPYRTFKDAKDGIFIHSSNRNGKAGNYKNNEGELHGISEGCLLIVPSRYTSNGVINGWDQFNIQLKGVNRFLIQLNRK